MYSISPELQIRVQVLKDMLVYRVDKYQCILTNDDRVYHSPYLH